MGRKNASSPAPYATSSIVQQQQQQQQQPRYQTRPGGPVFNMQQQQMTGSQQRPMHPLYQQQQQQQQPTTTNNIYQQMSTTSEIYPTQMASNRSAYSDQYYYPKEKIHITENKLSNCHTYDTANNQQHQQPQQTTVAFSNMGTLRRSANQQHSQRFKVINTQPQNYQLHLSDTTQHQKQQQMKMNSLNNNQNCIVGGNPDYNTQDMITKNLMDLDAGSFCYNGMADSGCGGSPSPMAMLMSHDDEAGEEQALYHTADGDNESDMERLYVKVDDPPQQQKQQQLISLTPSHHPATQQQQQQHQQHLHSASQERDAVNHGPYNNWRSHNSSTRSNGSQYQRGAQMTVGDSQSAASQQMHHLHPLHQQQPSSDSEMIYAPSSSMASERSLLSNSGSSTCGGAASGSGSGQAHNV